MKNSTMPVLTEDVMIMYVPVPTAAVDRVADIASIIILVLFAARVRAKSGGNSFSGID